ncbi:MAG: hypothetical protein ABR975_06595, partial [Vulcanimicrobiaceae bacterium]
GPCSGTGSATIASAGPIDTTTWLQTFTVTPVTAGTCTFALYDSDVGTGTGSPPTNTVTVTINP